MTDYDETRARRSRARPTIAKPGKQYIFFMCEHCNYSCTLEAPSGWRGTHHCSRCGELMVRK